MKPTIREATLEDVPAIADMGLRFRVQSGLYAELFPAERGRFVELATLLVQDHVVFVAEQRPPWAKLGQTRSLLDRWPLVGMLALAIVPHMLTGRLYGEEVAWWVDPAYRQGLSSVGPRLMHHMERHAVQKQLHMVKMLAPADSSVGDFYRKCGYQALETAWVKVF